MPDEKQHQHFGCPKCRTVFCNSEAEYEAMKAGDLCPECSAGTIELLPNVADDANIGSFADALRKGLSGMVPTPEASFEHAQAERVMGAAIEIYVARAKEKFSQKDHMTAALQAVDVAWAMERAIRSRVEGARGL